MPVFNYSSVIEAPVDVVFAFHERPDALELLTPPFPPVQIVRKNGGIHEGAEVELRVGPFRWLARHTIYVRNEVFVDQQAEGPFSRWIHTHRFEDLGAGTRLSDSVEYAVPGGFAINVAAAPFLRIGLLSTFRFRHRVTRAHCEKR